MSKFYESGKKYIVHDDRYLEENVLDRDTGYTSYRQIETLKVFGIRFRKQTKKASTKFSDKKEVRSTGYVNRQNT